MTLEERIRAVVALDADLGTSTTDEALQQTIARAAQMNPWFTEEFSARSIRAIRESFLSEDALRRWLEAYRWVEPTHPRRVGLVMAGNIPLVGFHDILCTFIAGHISLVKLSEKDNVLLPFILKRLFTIDERTVSYFEMTDRLTGFDAVIATGSDNSARYFEAYFSSYPHIIRRNRNAVAVLSGNETQEELRGLADDVFLYFGLGCRNVSKVYIPDDYDPIRLLEVFDQYEDMLHHHKYKNNFDYNLTLTLLNRQHHVQGKSILLLPADSLQSRIGTLHYREWNHLDTLAAELASLQGSIQCIVSSLELPGLKFVPFGSAQSPGLSDYADGTDTLAFLLNLSS